MTARVRGVASVVILVIAAGACAPAETGGPAPLTVQPQTCAPSRGGDEGAVMQLRRISFGNDQVSLLFVLRPGAPYGVPEHQVSSATGLVSVRVPGARLKHADGTPSFFGEAEPSPPPGAVRSVRIAEEAEGAVTVTIGTDAPACPRVYSRRYGLGTTFSGALVSIALRDGPVVALDPDRAAPGAAMQVIGVGFAASSPVTFQVRGRTVWSSRTGEDGTLDTVLFAPESPGRGAALVRDSHGSAALAWFLVDERFRR